MSKPSGTKSIGIDVSLHRAIELASTDQQVSMKALMAKAWDHFVATSAYPKPVTPALVPSSDSPTTAPVIDSGLAQTLNRVRALLEEATSELDGVLSDGQSISDQIGEIEAEVARIAASSGGAGGDSSAPPPLGVNKVKARRGR